MMQAAPAQVRQDEPGRQGVIAVAGRCEQTHTPHQATSREWFLWLPNLLLQLLAPTQHCKAPEPMVLAMGPKQVRTGLPVRLFPPDYG